MTDADICERIEKLPAISAAAPRLVSILSDPNTTASGLEEVIRLDPGLAGNLLRMANSAYFGRSGQVGSIRQAVVLLGLRQVSELVLAESVRPALDQPVAGYDLSAGDLWRHSLSVALASEELAAITDCPDRELAFAAGLLHDVGKLVIGQFVQEHRDAIDRVVASGQVSLDAGEQQILGTDHAEIGAAVLKHWRLPEKIVDVVRHHHDPSGAAGVTLLLDIVHVADTLSMMMGFGSDRDGLQYRLCPEAAGRLHLSTNQIEMVISKTLDETRRLAASLSTQDEGGPDGL